MLGTLSRVTAAFTAKGSGEFTIAFETLKIASAISGPYSAACTEEKGHGNTRTSCSENPDDQIVGQ